MRIMPMADSNKARSGLRQRMIDVVGTYQPDCRSAANSCFMREKQTPWWVFSTSNSLTSRN
jgi:ribosomal protein S16